MTTRHFARLFALLALAFVQAAFAQAPLAVNPRLLAAGTVFATVTQADGKVVIGGDFTRVGGLDRQRIARLNADGTVDAGWNPGANGIVRSLAYASATGLVYAGGEFTQIGGQARNRIAAIDPATGAATTWNPGSDGTVNAIAIDGPTVFAGGTFANFGGAARANVASVPTNSDTASSWNPGTNGTVKSIGLTANTVILGGGFTQAAGQTRNRAVDIAKSNGTASSWNPNANSDVEAVAVSGGNVYLAGNFTALGATTRNRLAAISYPAGAVQTWNPNASAEVATILIDGSNAYVGGAFVTVGGQPRTSVGAIDLGTGNASPWNPSVNGHVRAITRSGGNLFLGGLFTLAGGQSQPALAVFTGTGSATLVASASAGKAGRVYALAAQSDGKTVVGGDFVSAHDGTSTISRPYILRLNADGTIDAGWNPGTSYIVYSLAVDGSRVYAGGAFTQAGGSSRGRLAAFSASTGALDPWNPGANSTVNALLVDAGIVYAGGEFSTIGGQPRARLAAIDGVSGAATGWNPGADNTVASLALHGATLYAGGYFANAGGQPRVRIAGIDLASGAATAFNGNANNAVAALAVKDGVLYAGGTFTNIGGQTRQGIAALDVNTGAATPWSVTTGNVLAIAARGTNLYAGGPFTSFGGSPRNRIAAADIGTAVVDGWNPNLDGEVWAIAATPGLVIAGGQFAQAGGQPRDGLVILPAAGAGSYALDVGRIGNGFGTVTGSGINCGSTCSQVIAAGALVTLTATPDPGSVFTGWSAPCSGTGTCSFLMGEATNVTATFRSSFQLTGNATGVNGGGGQIVSDPAGIACGADCFEEFAPGTVVTMTAVPEPGAHLIGWSGACTGTGPCTVTMNADKTVAASFGQNKQLAVTATAGGKVTSMPTGINCPADCNETYADGTVVTLTTTPIGNAIFLGWTGSCSGTASTCVVTMDQNRLVGVEYLATYHLSVGRTNGFNSSGSVSSNPNGIQCPPDCNEDFDVGQTVMLTPQPDPGSVFTGWSGGTCSGTGSCTFTMNGNKAVIASFAQGPVLTVSRGGEGSGRVTSNPAGIDCGTDCTHDYSSQTGVQVTLTAIPEPGSVFAGWSGENCSGTGTCSVTMSAARYINAMFEPTRIRIELDGDGVVTGPGLECGNAAGLCEEIYPLGTVVTLTATAAPGSVFLGWYGRCSGTGTCDVTVDGDVRVGATFEAGAARAPRDFDGDGRSDIAWTDSNGQAALWLMNGTTPAGSALILGPSTGWTPADVDGDFNGDGNADILWRHDSGMYAVWLMDGTAPLDYAVILGPSTGWNVTHVADLDGDGRSDLVWKHADGSVSAWLMNGLSVAGSTILFGPGTPWMVTHVADISGDGEADLVWRNGDDGAVSAWLMNGLTAVESGFVFGGGTTWQVLGTGDFDGDGRRDLLFRDAAGQLSVFLMNGLTVVNSAVVYNGGPFDVTHMADFNGDGKADLLFTDVGGQVAVWLFDGLSVTGSAILFGGGGGWTVTHTGDYDGDGKADLLWRDSTGQVAIWTLDGTAVTGSAVIYGGNGGWVAF